MKFIVDAQLPQRLCFLLNDLGADAIHTLDLPEKNRTEDNTIVRTAQTEQRIVITKDRDFLQSHLIQNQPAKLLMVNTGNISNPALLHLFTVNFTFLAGLFDRHHYIELTREEIIVHE